MANCRGDLGAAEAGDWRWCQHELTKQVEDVRSRIVCDTPLRRTTAAGNPRSSADRFLKQRR
eukprot:8769777-Heterocapsa_arctica.AAC.1